LGLRPKPGRGAAALRPLRRPRAPGGTPGPRRSQASADAVQRGLRLLGGL